METGPHKLNEGGAFRSLRKRINGIIEQQRRLAPLAGIGIKVDRNGNGSVISVTQVPKAAKGTPGVITQYRLISVQDDYLTCQEFDGSAAGDTVLIAKPFNLRKTGWHGVTVTYQLEAFPGGGGNMQISYNYIGPTYRIATLVAGGVPGSEQQVILPRYVPGKSIIFASGSSNGTGVSSADLIDINADGRAFGRVLS